MLLLFLVGLLSIVAQVIVLRELAVAAFGVELVTTLALGAWLFWSAAGAGLGRDAGPPGRTSLAAACGLLGGLVLPVLVFIRASRVLFAGTPGAFLPLDRQAASLLLATLAPGVLAGAAFRLAARRAAVAGVSLARAYAVESAGALTGGVATTLAWHAGVQSMSLALACAAGGLAAAALAAGRPGRGAAATLWTACLLIAVGGARLAPLADQITARWNRPSLVLARDTPYGRVAVTREEGLAAVFHDDALEFTADGEEAEVFATLVLVNHPAPRRVLVLGGALEGLVGHALAHGARQVTTVEIDRAAFEAVRPLVPDETRASLSASGVRVLFDDPRAALERVAPQDVILIGVRGPATAQANRFYTREFFAACAGRLAPGGIVGLRLPVAENYWTPAQRAQVVSVARALAAAMPAIMVLPAPGALVLVGGVTDTGTADEPVARLASRAARPRLATVEFVRYVYGNDRRGEARAAIARGTTPPNSDARPVSFRFALETWLARFGPALDVGRSIAWIGARVWWGLAVGGLALVSLALWARCLPVVRLAVIVALAGFVGMALETVLVLHYQVTRGALFADLGLLLTSFMAGVAAGAGAAPGPALAARRTAVVLGAGLALLAFVVGTGIAHGGAAGLGSTLLLLLGTGGLVGRTFAWATHAAGGGTDTRAGLRLYAADLLGGCLAAVIGSLVLVPFAGLAATAWLCGVVAIVGLLLA